MGYAGTCYEKPLKRKKEALKALNTEAYEVLKAVLVGSVCYVACRERATEDVFGVVILTRISGDMIFTRPMSENCGPVEDACPASILNLLTAPATDAGREWRERCRKRLESPRPPKLPIGSYIRANGRLVLQKMAPQYQFRTPWYRVVGTGRYMPKSSIHAYELITKEEAEKEAENGI